MQLSPITRPSLPGFYQHDGVAPECLPYYIFTGSDEVVVFVHGLTGSPHDFRNFVPAYLQAGYDVVVPLLPGHGSHISRLERLSFRELNIPFAPLFDHLRGRYRKLHLVGLSYGAIFTTKLALDRPIDSISYLAPAFFLTASSEQNMRLVQSLDLQRFKSRIAKSTLAKKVFQPHPFTYAYIPFLPATQLHNQAQLLMARMEGLNWSVFHAHGDADDTTPIKENVAFLRRTVRDYTFYRVRGGAHVLPLGEGAPALAETHLAWLKGRQP